MATYLLGGVARIKNGHVENYTATEGPLSAQANAVVEDATGIFWLGGSRDLIIGKSNEVHDAFTRDIQSVGSFTVDSTGNVWILGLNQLLVFAIDKNRFITADKLGEKRVWSCLTAPVSGVLCVGAGGKAVSYTLVNRRVTQTTPSFPADLSTIFAAKDGSLWFGTDAGGLEYLSPSRGFVGTEPHTKSERFTTSDGLTGRNAFAFAQDREGGVWAATPGGLDQFRPMSFQPVTLAYAAGPLTFSHAASGPAVLAGTNCIIDLAKHPTSCLPGPFRGVIRSLF